MNESAWQLEEGQSQQSRKAWRAQMPEVNFAREREREERAGDWPESQFVVRSRIPAGREGVGPMAVSWPVVKHGGETLECVFIWRNMPCTMPVIAHVLL